MIILNFILLCNFSLILIAATKNDDEAIDDLELFLNQINRDYMEKRKSILEASWNYELTRDERFLEEKYNVMEEYEELMMNGKKQIENFQWSVKGISNKNLKNQFKEITRLIQTTRPVHLEKQIDKVFLEVNSIYPTFKINRTEEDFLKLMDDFRSKYEQDKIRWQEKLEVITEKIEPQLTKYLLILQASAKHYGVERPIHVLSQEEGISLSHLRRQALKELNEMRKLLEHLYYHYHKQLPQINVKNYTHPELEGINIRLLDYIHENNPMLKPFPNVKDVIRKAIEAKSELNDWIQLANNYYSSMGFEKLDEKIILANIMKLNSTHSNGKTLMVWNFFNGDYRMSWTPTDAEEDMKNIFLGLGKIHNIKQFKNLPPINQNWLNEIFQEAIAGAASLSALSPQYLKKIGVLEATDDITDETIINGQMRSILKLFNLKALPLGVITDAFTEEIYNINISIKKYKEDWWPFIAAKLNIRYHYNISDYSKYFGPGLIENIMPASKHIKALLSEILKYQFFQRLCIAAGQFKPWKPNKLPLHRCDISSNSDKVIELLTSVMQQGNTISWEAMVYEMTGDKNFNIKPLFNYYYPLIQWLKKEVPLRRLKKFGKNLKDDIFMDLGETYQYKGRRCKDGGIYTTHIPLLF